jgi:hypothetical protein
MSDSSASAPVHPTPRNPRISSRLRNSTSSSSALPSKNADTSQQSQQQQQVQQQTSPSSVELAEEFERVAASLGRLVDGPARSRLSSQLESLRDMEKDVPSDILLSKVRDLMTAVLRQESNELVESEEARVAAERALHSSDFKTVLFHRLLRLTLLLHFAYLLIFPALPPMGPYYILTAYVGISYLSLLSGLLYTSHVDSSSLFMLDLGFTFIVFVAHLVYLILCGTLWMDERPSFWSPFESSSYTALDTATTSAYDATNSQTPAILFYVELAFPLAHAVFTLLSGMSGRKVQHLHAQ